MKIGDLVTWKSEPGSIAMIINTHEGKVFAHQKVIDLFWSDPPPRLAGIMKDGIIHGFAPWELDVINESR